MGIVRFLLILLLLVSPARSAITRTAQGTAQTKTAASVTCGSFDPADTDRVVVVLAADDLTNILVEWNATGFDFNQDVAVLNPGNAKVQVWSASGADLVGSSSILVTITAGASYACACLTLGGGNGLPVFDTSAGGSGTGTDASTSDSITCTPNSGSDCAWVGNVGTEGPDGDTSGTWVNPNNAGQRLGTTGAGAAGNITVSEGFEIDAGAVTQALSKTGMTSRDWGAALATYKEPAAGGAVIKDLIMRGLLATPR